MNHYFGICFVSVTSCRHNDVSGCGSFSGYRQPPALNHWCIELHVMSYVKQVAKRISWIETERPSELSSLGIPCPLPQSCSVNLSFYSGHVSDYLPSHKTHASLCTNTTTYSLLWERVRLSFTHLERTCSGCDQRLIWNPGNCRCRQYFTARLGKATGGDY